MVSRLGPGAEFDLIRSFLEKATSPPSDRTAGPDAGPDAARRAGVRVGAGDDCAVVTGDGIALSVDMTVEDVHFRRAWLPMVDLGYHAAAGALSDLAAVAARPIGILASVALGPDDERGPGRALMEGVSAAASDVGAVLLGGDLTRSPGPLVVDIVAIGEASAPVLRSGARAGHEVWVTGELGGAAAAVAAWLEGREPDPAAVRAYARPRPRTREALWLLERGVLWGMVDLSDGLAGDAGHIAAASGVRVVIEADALPIAAAARAAAAAGGDAAGPDGAPADRALAAVRLAAAGGEDYELCFTAEPGAVAAVRSAFEAELGVALTRVGRVEAADAAEGRAVVVDAGGRVLEMQGFQHWRNG